MSELTERAKCFRDANQKSPITEGAWFDKDDNPIEGAPRTARKLRYRLADGGVVTLDLTDITSLNAAGVKPRWVHGE